MDRGICMKKFVLFIVCLFLFMSPVLADKELTCFLNENHTSSFTVDAKIPDTVHVVILAIQVIVPVLLVIFGLIDFIKGITASKEDEIKKGRQTFISRLIAGVLVFFIIAIVKLVISLAAGSDNANIMKCVNCFLGGTNDTNCLGKKIIR